MKKKTQKIIYRWKTNTQKDVQHYFPLGKCKLNFNEILLTIIGVAKKKIIIMTTANARENGEKLDYSYSAGKIV